MNQRRTVGVVIEEGGPVVQRGDAHWLRRGRSANSRVGGSGARKRRERGGLASSEQVELGDVQLRRERGRKRARREGGKAARDGAFLYSQGVFQVGRRQTMPAWVGGGFAVACFPPCKGPRTEESSRQSSQLPRTTTSPQDRKQAGPSKLYFPHEIVGFRRGSLLTDVCIAVAFDGFAACQLSTSRS
jgi:hypothetical protein